MRLEVLEIPQADGWSRLIATTRADAERVYDDRAYIDCVAVVACMDINEEGFREWAFPFGCEDTKEGRRAIRAYLRGEDD